MDKILEQKRLSSLRQKLLSENLDAFLVTDPLNFTYLSGFTGTSAFLFITYNHAFLITDFRYVEQAHAQSCGYQILKYRDNIFGELNNLITKYDIKIFGLEAEHLSYAMFKHYQRELHTPHLVPTYGLVEQLRIRKDKQEIAHVKQASKIADMAFAYILNYIKPGIAEVDVAAELDYFMRKNGADRSAFQTIVASGKRSSLVHGVATCKKLEANDIVLLDYGAVYNGYCSDISRTVFIGKVPAEFKNIYNIVLDAQAASIANIKSGIAAKDIDGLARKVIDMGGYGQNFGHSLGHGIGLNVHEKPYLSANSDSTLAPNMIVSVEPGIYVRNVGGVRIEDTVLVHPDNAEILTKASKAMIVLNY